MVLPGRGTCSRPSMSCPGCGAGGNNFRLRISSSPVRGPPDTFHLLAAMSRESVELHQDKLKDPALILADAAWELPRPARHGAHPPLPNSPRVRFRNVALLGVLEAMLGLEASCSRSSLRSSSGAKGDEIVSSNMRVLASAVERAAENAGSPSARKHGPVRAAEHGWQSGRRARGVGRRGAFLRVLSHVPGHHHRRGMQDALRALHLPCVQPERPTLFDAPEVQDVVALLDALVSTGHDLALARALK